MPNEPTEAEAKLRKLGERLRDGWAKQHPTPEGSLETVRSAVREQWEKEQEANRSKSPELDSPTKPEREPPKPDFER